MTSNVKITALPAATTLTGSEELPAVQGGITKRTSIDDIVLHGISSNQLAAAGPVETSGLTIASARLVGRTSPGVGPVEQITVGAGLIINDGQLQSTTANAYPLTGGQLNGTLILQPGTTAAPSLQFKNDTDTGLYHAASDAFGLVTGGAERVRIANTEVTVNTSLIVDASARARGDLRVDRADTNSEGGRLVSRRASDNADGYYWQTHGSGSTPVFRLMRAFGTPTQMLSISDSGAVTVTGPLTLPAFNPTHPNHATRKAYVDAGDRWVTLVDADIANSAVIDVTGFSLADYHLVEVHLLNVLPTANSSSNVVAQVYRNQSLVSTGYNRLRLSVFQTGVNAAVASNASSCEITTSGIRTERLVSNITISQTESDQMAMLRAITFYQENTSNFMHCMHSDCRATGGSGWVDGLRITSPVDLTANVGRLVVMGLKKS
jgi:CRISPR/Cas system-associated protein endoribonuclease Cas2